MPGECWPHQVFGWQVVVSRSRLSWIVSVYLARCEPRSSSVQAAGATIAYVTLCT